MSANVNTTTNITQALNCFGDPATAAKIGQTVAYCLIFVVSLVGNSLVGITVYKTNTMKTTINFLFVNMAMADLLYSIYLIPQELTELYSDSWLISGPLGQVLCKLTPFLRDGPVSVSIQSLVLITVDRFGAVVFPLRSPLISSKLCPFFILVIWIVAMAIWSPWFFANKLVKNQTGRLACVAEWNEAFGQSSWYENYILALLSVSFYAPSVLLAILYTIIYVKVKSLAIPDERSANERQPLLQREQTVLKEAIAIVLGFAVCWLPWSIVMILVYLVSDIWSCGFQYFYLIAFFLCYANCAINPCIYFIFSKNNRQALKNLLNRCNFNRV